MCIRDSAGGVERAGDDGMKIAVLACFAGGAGGGCFCLLYTSDAAAERSSGGLGGRRIIQKNKKAGVNRLYRNLDT